MSNALIINEIKQAPLQTVQHQQQQQQQQQHQHSIIYDYEKAEKLCSSCGIIIQDKIYDAELDADFYKLKSDTNTVMPQSLMLNDKGMSTTIADYDTTTTKRFSNRKEHNKIQFLSKVVSCSNSKRNLKIVIDLLNRIKDKLSLPSTCIEDALLYYKKALSKGLIKGRSIKEIVVACVYIVCKQINIPRTLSEISKIVEADEVFTGRCYRLLMRELKVKHSQFNPSVFIRKIANEADISERTARESIDMLMAIQNDSTFAGKNSLSIAAAILYISCKKHKQRISQSKIAAAANINIMTLRKRLSETRTILMNTQFLN